MVNATCAALHCLSSSHTNKKLKFHQFPHDNERRKAWIAACKRTDVIDKGWDFFKHKYICSEHFEKCMYSRKKHLKKSAIPSLHLSKKPLQHDSSTQTVESIQYAHKKSEKDESILFDIPKIEKNSTITDTQTERYIKEDILTQTELKESETTERDVEIKTENDDDENSDSESFKEDVEIKTETVENEILPLLKSAQSLMSVDIGIRKDGGTRGTQAKNQRLPDIDQGLAEPIIKGTNTCHINTTTTTPILKNDVDVSIQTDRVIVLNRNDDGTVGSLNPEECKCKRNDYLDMTRLQFYKACSKFLSADFAITVRRKMHLDDLAKAESSGTVQRRKTHVPETVELNACGEVDASDVVIASTDTAADGAETDLDVVDRVEACAAVTATDCDQSVEPECPAASDLDKKDCDVTGKYHYEYDHVRQEENEVSSLRSLQSIPRPVAEASGITIKKRKLKKVRCLVENVAEGSELESEIEDDFDLDEITSSGDSMARNIPDDADLDDSIIKIVNSVERVMDNAIDKLVGENDFIWRADFDTFQGVPEHFSGPSPGPIKDYNTPYEAFIDIWSNDIIEHIVIETNRYGRQMIYGKTAARTLKPPTRLPCWTDTNKEEISIFFALHILMGLDQRATQQDFWKRTGYLEMPKFRKLMKYSRFLLLTRVFHFEDSSGQNMPQSGGISLTAKWRKIAPIVGHLNKKFSSLYNLHANIAIDESLTKGRFSWGQAIKSKISWNGMKSYELCDSITGYLYKFEIYTEMNSKQDNFASLSETLAKKSTQVVLDLLTGLENKGHCITMDNFCNSPALARHLKSIGIDCLGTLRPNRKNVPLEVKYVPKNVAKGTIIARHCGDVSCIAWNNNKMVTMISTYHNSETCTDRDGGQEVVTPVVIRDYNKIIKGVNLKEKKLSMYIFERKKTIRRLKWYMKIFIRLLNVSVRNAFILLSGSLHRRGMPLCTDRDFREELANSLLAINNKSPEQISVPVEEKYTRLRKDILHIPKYHTNLADRWRCFICSRKGIQKMVYSSCVTCNEYICFEGCWSDWHSLPKLPAKSNVSGRKRKHSA